MADLFCDFLYFQSLTTNYNLPLFLPPKQYFSSSLHSHNSRFSKILRPSPHLQLLHNHKPSPFAVSASDIDLISIHEHSDGSFLFRFGDPSEVEKNVEMEESRIIKEEIEGEDTDVSRMVQVMEGEDETEGAASVLTEASYQGDSIVSSSNTLIAVEGETEFSEKLLVIPVDSEVPVLTSNEELGGISSQDLDMEQIEDSEGVNEEYKDSVTMEASIPDESTKVEVFYEESSEEKSNVTFTSKEMEMNAIPSIDIGQQVVNVEESLNKEDVDPPADTSILDQSSEEVDNITTVALLEKENDDISSAGIDAYQIGGVEEDLDGDYEDTPADASVLDKSSEVENEISAVVLMENETDGSTSSSDIEIEPTENVEEHINEENEDSLVDSSLLDKKAEVLDNTKAALSEKEAADITTAPCEDSSVDASVLDKSSEVEYGISAVLLLEEETDGNTSTHDVEIEPTGNVEKGENEEYEDPPADDSVLEESSEVENGITAVVLLENKADDGSTSTSSDIEIEPTENEEERINEEYENSLVDTSVLNKKDEVLDNTKAALSEKEAADITSAPYEDSPVAASVLDKSSKVEYGLSAVVLLEEETDGNNPTCDIEIEQIGNVEEGKNEEYEDSPTDASVLDKSSEVENGISDVVLLENETDDGDNEIQPTGNVEERINEDYEESLVDTSVLDKRAEVLNNTKAALSEQEAADTTSAPYEDSPVDASVLDKSPKVEYGISAVVEEEADGNTSTHDIEIEPTVNMEAGKNEEYEDSPVDKRAEILIDNVAASSKKEVADVSYGSDIDREDTDNVEQSLDEVHEQPSSVDASRPYQRSEVENVITAQEFLEQETTNATTPVALKNDPVISELDIDAGQGGLETGVTKNVVTFSELHNAETAIHHEKIGDDKLVSPSSDSELAMSLYEETEVPNIQAEMQNLATEESSETDVDNSKVVDMPNVLSNDTEGNMYDAEDVTPSMESAAVWSLGSEQASGSGSEMPNETVGYESEGDVIHLLTSSQLEANSVLEEETGTETVEEPRTDDGSENQTVGGNLAEASVHEMTAPESTITSQEILVTDFVLSSGAALLPHPSKVLTGGEDAYFIADQTWFGVADGVGQWSLDGTAPGCYAQELMKNCENVISNCSGILVNNPVELLNLSVAQTHSPGSSTVLIAHFDGQALHVANVGDSGFIILRHGAVYKRSSSVHHVFSLPVRIGRGDDPSSLAQLYKVDLEEDIIVIATDGLFDNLYNQEILLIAMKSLADYKTPEEIAELLAKRAQEVGSSASARSPFADEAQAAGFPAYSGGMLDDVAVIVSVVRRR